MSLSRCVSTAVSSCLAFGLLAAIGGGTAGAQVNPPVPPVAVEPVPLQPTAAAPPAASGPPPEAAAAPPVEPSPSFVDAADVEDASLGIKAYGDTQFGLRNHSPVHASFAAAHLDLFITADVGRLSFLSEVFFEPEDNEMGMDLERIQINYLFANWLRVRAGRMHTAFGYYNDTYHHGNLFELTTGRPFGAQFEDDGGMLTAHLVGIGVDGTFPVGDGGSFRYDLEVGNGRYSDITKVAIEQAAKDDKLINLRLRYSPLDGLIFGVNAQHDTVPALSTAMLTRPRASELTFGAHVVYMVDAAHVLLEGFVVSHDPRGAAKATTSLGGFAELGYKIGDFTPYVRPELLHFPKNGDVVYQAADSFYAGTRNLFDLRVGVRYQPLLQLALKLELERVARDGDHQESATLKAAFGF